MCARVTGVEKGWKYAQIAEFRGNIVDFIGLRIQVEEVHHVSDCVWESGDLVAGNIQFFQLH